MNVLIFNEQAEVSVLQKGKLADDKISVGIIVSPMQTKMNCLRWSVALKVYIAKLAVRKLYSIVAFCSVVLYTKFECTYFFSRQRKKSNS